MGRPIEFPVAGLSDGRIVVRLPADADIPRLVEACRDPLVVRYTTVPPDYQPHHGSEWIRRGSAGIASGTDVSCVIADARDGGVLGTASLHEVNRQAARCVAGYYTAAWARGRGVATTALRLLCDFGFRELRLERIELAIEPENAASRAVARRVGFTEEGLLRSYLPIAGARRDMLMCSLLPADIGSPARTDGATLKG